jgi:hypothetical protein
LLACHSIFLKSAADIGAVSFGQITPRPLPRAALR